MADVPQSGWNNPSAPPKTSHDPLTYDQMAERVREMEALCADVYSAAVELGLPRDLLNRLWVVAGGGTAPQAFAVDPKHALKQIDAPAKRQASAATPAALPPLKRRRTVLVADDDPRMLELLERILRRDNYELIMTESGPAAIAAMKGRPTLDLRHAQAARVVHPFMGCRAGTRTCLAPGSDRIRSGSRDARSARSNPRPA